MDTLVIKNNTISHNWYIINAEKKILGRLASKVAYFLMGKHKPEYVFHLDVGDYIIIINANKVVVTGNKYHGKVYYYHTGYAGGIKKVMYKNLIVNNAKWIIKHAVKGMLPKSSLGKSMYKKLKVYNGTEHKHIAQSPKIIKI